MSKKTYKVWVHIEELVDGEPQGREPVLSDSLGSSEGRGALKKAVARVAEVVNHLVHGRADRRESNTKAEWMLEITARRRSGKPGRHRTGSKSAYERGDVVETPVGIGTIATDPDERGRCIVRLAKPLAGGDRRISATTFQFGRIARKWNAKATAKGIGRDRLSRA